MGARRDGCARVRTGRVTGRATGGATGTRADHERFVVREGWRRSPSTHHETYELTLPDGHVLRTRISRPPDRTTSGARLWAHVLRDQLHVTEQEFWACVRDGALPDRRPDPRPDAPDTAIPFEVAELLVGRVGLRREDLVGMSRDDAIARLNAFWATGR
jgi:hypothetical protein